MNDNKDQNTPISPYRGIHPFRYVDHPHFFGREKVVENLFAKVLLYRLVLLFGESGTGKSSVVNAGLFPALNKEGFNPERLRVRPFAEEPILIERVPEGDQEDGPFLHSIFCDETNAQERVIPCSIEGFLETIRQKAKEAQPALIFDQFEELFTLFSQSGSAATEGDDLQSRILNTIFEIVNNQTLKVKVVIIIREDFLGKLEILSKKYPQIFDNYVRLEHMDETGAKKAILGPFENKNPFPARLSPELAEITVQELSHHGTTNQIHTTQLQIICSTLWKRYASTRQMISVDEFKELGRVKGILEGYLKFELDRVGKTLRPTAVMILGNLITESGTRDIVSEEKIRGLVALKKSKDKNVASQALNVLEKRKVINRTSQRGTYFYEVASEYLIDAIQKEVKKISLHLERKRRRIRLSQVFAGFLILAFIVSYSYFSWLVNRPWGYLRNLSTGTVHVLEGGMGSIGRPTEALSAFKNTINLRPSSVSRFHLLISRDLAVVDLRTLLGTSVNENFLPYGDSLKLQDGDIVVVGDIAPFQFQTIAYSPLQFWTPSIKPSAPPSGWGILIDMQSKTFEYLSEERYYLSLDERGRIIPMENESDDTLFEIRKLEDIFEIKDRRDGIDLLASMKTGATYTYRECTVPSGKYAYYFDWKRLQCRMVRGRSDEYKESEVERIYSHQVIYKSSNGARFRIIPVVPNLEPLRNEEEL